MKTKLVKKLGVLALCGTLFCNAFGVTANAITNDYLTATMKWSGTKCTVTTDAYSQVIGRGYTAKAYVFLYNSSGSLLGSNNASGTGYASTELKKSKVSKAMGANYIQGVAGDVYGYVRETRAKGKTY